MSVVPTFVVVGNVNQGKSSIVATLSENADVPIAMSPGTTRRSGDYEYKSGDRVLFRLVDTPGFQEARAALAWMREHSLSAMDHPDVVRRFVESHRGEERVQDEVRLLEPILDGASILYVIDASGAPQPSNEAEMEILRWTGQPSMALVNRTGDRNHADDWRPYLEQFFNVVRTFDAQGASFEDRMGLLRSFRELREDWHASIDASIEAMGEEQARRQEHSAAAVADLLVDALSHVEKRELETQQPTDDERAALEKAYRRKLRLLEADARTEIERLHGHRKLERQTEKLPFEDADLFSEASWKMFGLTRAQLTTHGVVWGAAIGTAVDLMVGGLSFFTGTVIGGVVGGAGAFMLSTRVARTWSDTSRLAKRLFPGETGRFLAMGPATNPRFAWMLLDRALTHYVAVRDRTHARQGALVLPRLPEGKQGIAAGLEPGVRRDLNRKLSRILTHTVKSKSLTDVEAELRASLLRVMRAPDLVSSG
jgi:hypothetical protein